MFELPHSFGRYTLTRLLGEGGMAEVYQASVRVAEGLTKWVVIKKIKAEFADQREFTRMFVDEAKIALSLNHANIVQVFDFGQIDGGFFLAMELIEGLDLMRLFHAVRAQQKAFPAVIAAYIGHQVASGLSYAHRKKDEYGQPLGIVHRDVSPHNVMLSYDGQVKVLDFGIARTRPTFEERRRQALHGSPEETIKGKIAYMSPEQAHGTGVDPRSDVYSLGIVLYELLTGELLYRGRDRLAQLERVRSETLPPILERAPELPDELARIVDRALERDPEARFSNAREMQNELAHFLHSADPMVDDEVMTNFLEAYRLEDETDFDDEGSFSQVQTREIGDSRSEMPLEKGSASKRVVLLQLAFESDGQAGQESVHRFTRAHDLIRDIAFKREAHVVKLDNQGALLAFGTLVSSGDDPERAVRVANAMREGLGESFPELRVGSVLLATHVTIHRSSAGRSGIELPDGLEAHISAVARRAYERELLVSVDLFDRLRRLWRFGSASPPSPEVPNAHAGSPWAAAFAQVVPLQGALSEAERRRAAPIAGKRLLGRELEFKALRDGFSQAIRASKSRSVLIVAAPGLGKRALVHRFVGSLPPASATVLRGSGRWATRNLPLGVFLELLRAFLRIGPNTHKRDIAALLREHDIAESRALAEALVSALNLPGQEETHLDPTERRDRLIRLIRRLVRALAAKRPLLIVIDNLHFVDTQSVDVLEEFAEREMNLPIYGITTSRPGPRAAAFAADSKDGSARFKNLTVLTLNELDERARRELVESRFEDPEDARPIIDAVVERAGGNPLFIEQVLSNLLDRGTIGWNRQARLLVVRDRGAEIDLPPTIEDALRSRIEGLAPKERTILQGASILGMHFRGEELPEILERPNVPELESLIAERLLVPSPAAPGQHPMRFSTISLHQVCKESVLPAQATYLHRLAAQIKRARRDYTPGRDDGPIAEHLLAAGEYDAAIEPALRAANKAAEVGGAVEAYYHISQALKAMDNEDPRRFEALLQREPILRAWGKRRAQGADIRALIATAESLDDPRKEIIASTRLLRFYIECGRMHRASRLVPRIEAMAQRHHLEGVFAAVLGELNSEIALARGLFDEAREFASAALEYTWDDQPGERRGRRQRFRLLRCLAKVDMNTGKLEDARAHMNEAMDLARRMEHRRYEAEARTLLGEIAGRQTRYQSAVDHFKAALAIDRDLGDRYTTGVKLANLGITYTAIGLYRRAERYLRKALELHEAIGHPSLLNEVMVNLGEVSFELGDGPAAMTLLEEAIAVARSRDDIRTELRARNQLVRVLVSHQHDPADLDRAEKMAQGIVEVGRREGLRSAIVRGAHSLSKLAVLRGDYAQAIDLAREAARLVETGAARMDGPRALHHLGLLLRERPEFGAPGESERFLREAALRVAKRLEELTDPELRHGYQEQREVQLILEDHPA